VLPARRANRLRLAFPELWPWRSSDGSVCEPGHLGDRQFGLFQGHGAPYGFGLGPLENSATAHEFVGGGRLRKRFAHPVFVGHVAVRAGHLNIRMPSFAERAYVCRDPGQDRILRDRTQDVQGMTPVTLQLLRNRSVHLDLLWQRSPGSTGFRTVPAGPYSNGPTKQAREQSGKSYNPLTCNSVPVSESAHKIAVGVGFVPR
jgi:hypothetical protein